MTAELFKAVEDQNAVDVFMRLAELDAECSPGEMERSDVFAHMDDLASGAPSDVFADGVKVATVQRVVREGGSEGEGDHVERVVKITIGEHVFYVRFTGFYNSYEGTDWSCGDLGRVYPREVVVTQYFAEP